MRKTKFLFTTMILAALICGFNACSNTPDPDPDDPILEVGDGTKDKPFSVLQTIGKQGSKDNTDYKWVTGYVVGIWEGKDAEGNDLYPNNFVKLEAPFYSDVNILLADKADETNKTKFVCVQLPSSMRSVLSPMKKADILKQKISVQGSLENYNSMPGVKNLQAYKTKDGESGEPGTGTGEGTESSPYNVTSAMVSQGANKWVEGYIVGNVDGQGMSIGTESKFEAPFTIATNILIAASATEKDYSKCLPIQLPAGDVRAGLNLKDNAGNLGKKVKLAGSLESYFGVNGLKSVVYYELEGGSTGGTKPADTGNAILFETLLTQASYDKFAAYSVTGTQVWAFSSSYGATMSGFENDNSYENEDWFISPAINLEGKTSVKLSFDHARGPAGSINIGVAEGYYTVWVSNNYSSGAPSTATWTEIKDITHGTAAWGYVSSGELTIPAANLKANAKIAFKYLSIEGKSATWEIKNVLLK